MSAGNYDLFINYLDRQSFRAATGQEAPIADPSHPLKTWFDPTPPAADADGYVTYFRLPKPNSGEGSGLIPFRVPAFMAGSLNLPGMPNFPPYVPAPSGGVVLFPNGGTEIIPAIMLSTREQADETAAYFSTDALKYTVEEQITENAAADGLPFEYASTEPRRIFSLVVGPNGSRLNVGRLIAAERVGGPGHWDLNMNATGGPRWISDPVNTLVAVGDSVPMPAKPLGAGQRVVYYDFFGFQIVAYATL